MSLSHDVGHNAHMMRHSLEGIRKTKKPLEGAAWGAMATASGAMGTLAVFGLALTPVGWAAALGAGAIAGATYVAKKRKG